MSTYAIIIIAVVAAAVLAAGLRWAVKPAIIGFRLGTDMGHMLQASDAPPPPAIEVAVAWVMPWRAARLIRSQKRQMNLLIRTLAHAVGDGRDALLEGHRPDAAAWYDRSMPLAVLAALARPARAVRKLRSSDDAITWMLDAMLAQQRKHHEAEQLAS